MKALKAVTLNFEPIEQSMRDLCRDTNDYYFNKTTGRVAVLSKGLIHFLTQEDDGHREALPDWEAKMIPVARQILVEGSSDFVRIPEAFGQPEHAWMAKFSGDVRSIKLRQKIRAALRGRGACRRFREIISEHPDEKKKWVVFRSRCWKEKIQGWLEGFGILAVENSSSHSRTPQH
jgi:hypothetical protein